MQKNIDDNPGWGSKSEILLSIPDIGEKIVCVFLRRHTLSVNVVPGKLRQASYA
jgi:hypothetical protein